MKDQCLRCGEEPCRCRQPEECRDCEHPEIDWCVDCCLRCKRTEKKIREWADHLRHVECSGIDRELIEVIVREMGEVGG